MAAIKNHPDKGGDPEKFEEIIQAYEVLSDSEKRRYMMSTMKTRSRKEWVGTGMVMIHLISFSLSSVETRLEEQWRAQTRRGEDVIHPLKVTLEDLYTGTSKKHTLCRNVLCSQCKGKVSKSGASKKCSDCRGLGVKVLIHQLGPFMIRQMQQPLKCKGTGETINEKDQCPQCKGKKVLQEKKVLHASLKRVCRMDRRSPSPARLMRRYACFSSSSATSFLIIFFCNGYLVHWHPHPHQFLRAIVSLLLR